MGKLKPIGSEKLQGMDKINRMIEITDLKAKGELKTVFRDGKLLIDWTLGEVRERVRKGLTA
jgi:hypothetical protein